MQVHKCPQVEICVFKLKLKFLYNIYLIPSFTLLFEPLFSVMIETFRCGTTLSSFCYSRMKTVL